MYSKDTIGLLKECSSGVKIALDGINGLLEYAKTPALRGTLQKGILRHEEAGHEKACCCLTKTAQRESRRH